MPFLQQGRVKYSIIFEKKINIFRMTLHHSVAIAFYLSSSSCLLLIYKMIGSSTMLYASTISTFVVSASSVPISQGTTNKLSLHFFRGNCLDPGRRPKTNKGTVYTCFEWFRIQRSLSGRYLEGQM